MTNVFKNIIFSFLFLLASISLVPSSWAEDLKDLDGVEVKAIEEYPPVKASELTVGFTYLPIHSYYHGVGFNLGYAKYYNERWGWEILNVNALMGVEKSVADELIAPSNPGVQPVAEADIEQPQFIVSSNAKYVLGYGKSIFFDKFIRLTRLELLTGLGMIGTNIDNYLTVNFGFQLDFVVSDDFSWKLEFMNYYNTQQTDAEIFEYAAIRCQAAWRF